MALHVELLLLVVYSSAAAILVISGFWNVLIVFFFCFLYFVTLLTFVWKILLAARSQPPALKMGEINLHLNEIQYVHFMCCAHSKIVVTTTTRPSLGGKWKRNCVENMQSDKKYCALLQSNCLIKMMVAALKRCTQKQKKKFTNSVGKLFFGSSAPSSALNGWLKYSSA